MSSWWKPQDFLHTSHNGFMSRTMRSSVKSHLPVSDHPAAKAAGCCGRAVSASRGRRSGPCTAPARPSPRRLPGDRRRVICLFVWTSVICLMAVNVLVTLSQTPVWILTWGPHANASRPPGPSPPPPLETGGGCMKYISTKPLQLNERMVRRSHEYRRLQKQTPAGEIRLTKNPEYLRGVEGIVDWNTIASNCSTGNCLYNLNKRISSKNSNWKCWYWWGFPTVSTPLPNNNAPPRRLPGDRGQAFLRPMSKRSCHNRYDHCWYCSSCSSFITANSIVS